MFRSERPRQQLGDHGLGTGLARQQTLDRFHYRMIQVHLDGLRLLRNPAAHPEAIRKEVLEGLRVRIDGALESVAVG